MSFFSFAKKWGREGLKSPYAANPLSQSPERRVEGRGYVTRVGQTYGAYPPSSAKLSRIPQILFINNVNDSPLPGGVGMDVNIHLWEGE